MVTFGARDDDRPLLPVVTEAVVCEVMAAMDADPDGYGRDVGGVFADENTAIARIIMAIASADPSFSPSYGGACVLYAALRRQAQIDREAGR